MTLRAEGVAGNRLRLTITDKGRGIPPDKLNLLFRPFSRLGAERDGVEGHGIGLALCKRLVEFMDGTIGVHSEPGTGTSFWVEFQRIAASDSIAGEIGIEEALALDEALVGCRDKRVLFVEDNPVNRILVGHVLERFAGITLDLAETGREGLDLIRDRRYDLLLLDMQLPDMSGLDVLAAVRQQGLGVPALMFSANTLPEFVSLALQRGASGYLAKPIEVRKFKAALVRYLVGAAA